MELLVSFQFFDITKNDAIDIFDCVFFAHIPEHFGGIFLEVALLDQRMWNFNFGRYEAYFFALGLSLVECDLKKKKILKINTQENSSSSIKEFGDKEPKANMVLLWYP